jgi:CRP/FNR family transcriptional regulator, dissimilatory nitrate respiration regulator
MRDDVAKIERIIANSSLYRMLTPRQIERIAEHTSPLRAVPNVTVIQQGDPALGTYWIVYGQVHIAVNSKQGGVKMLAILGANKCFGLGEMVMDQPHQTCVTTTADTMLLHTEREVILDVADENPAFAREVMICLGRQFCGLVRDIGSYALNAHQRLADYLLRQGGERVANAEIALVANKGVIAARLSLTPETLSRVFRDFSKDGLIQVNNRRITVLDWPRMEAMLA